MKPKLTPQENRSGDPQAAAQGFGRVTSGTAPLFDPVSEQDAALLEDAGEATGP